MTTTKLSDMMHATILLPLQRDSRSGHVVRPTCRVVATGGSQLECRHDDGCDVAHLSWCINHGLQQSIEGNDRQIILNYNFTISAEVFYYPPG